MTPCTSTVNTTRCSSARSSEARSAKSTDTEGGLSPHNPTKRAFPVPHSAARETFYINGSVPLRKNPYPTLSRLVCLPINICRRNIPWGGRAEDTPKYIRGISGMIYGGGICTNIHGSGMCFSGAPPLDIFIPYLL